jgi:hypothetical protein
VVGSNENVRCDVPLTLALQPFAGHVHPMDVHSTRSHPMRPAFALLLLLAPLAAHANDSCKFQAPRHLTADLAGVRGVRIEVNSYDLHLTGDSGAKGLTLDGRACASSQALLDTLTVSQRRDGDQLVVQIGGERNFSFSLFGNSSTNLDVNVSVPASLPVTVEVGSGDADVKGVAQLDSHIGSGDLHVHSVAGRFASSVGSGDVDGGEVGSLELGSVGSGDLKLSDIKGDARIGSIGSGDVSLNNVGGSVHADTLGSGDLSVDNVGGDFQLGAKGSGDVNHHGVKGKVSVPNDDD